MHSVLRSQDRAVGSILRARNKASPTAAPPAAQSPPAAVAAPPAPVQAPVPVARPAAAKPPAFAPAKEAVQKAAKELDIKLTGAQAKLATELVQQGHEPVTVLKHLRAHEAARELQRQLGTPTDAEMEADFAKQAKSGKKSLMEAYGGEQ